MRSLSYGSTTAGMGTAAAVALRRSPAEPVEGVLEIYTDITDVLASDEREELYISLSVIAVLTLRSPGSAVVIPDPRPSVSRKPRPAVKHQLARPVLVAVANEPMSTRNSPTKPLSPGTPMLDSITTVKAAANTGATFCRPVSAEISRVWRRS